jgi:hypothetical protein
MRLALPEQYARNFSVEVGRLTLQPTEALCEVIRELATPRAARLPADEEVVDLGTVGEGYESCGALAVRAGEVVSDIWSDVRIEVD